MLTVPAKRDAARPVHSFAVAAHEISNALFGQFVNSLDRDHPHYQPLKQWQALRGQLSGSVAFVTYSEATRFCNWLSERDGLQPYYVNFKTQGELQKRIVESCEVDESATGYRLPTDQQFAWLCQALSSEEIPIGGPEHVGRLEEYVVFPSIAENWQTAVIAPSGTCLPNDLGAFDTLGNLMEWVTPSEPQDDLKVKLWGYLPSMPRELPSEELSLKVRPTAGFFPTGFRVCLTEGSFPDR